MKTLKIEPLKLSLAATATWILLSGCAGPHSPFGSIDLSSGDGALVDDESETSREVAAERTQAVREMASINSVADRAKDINSFSPKRQVLHQPSDVELDIDLRSLAPSLTDSRSRGDNTPLDLRVIYNKHDVTNAFNRKGRKLQTNEHLVKVTYTDLHLTADKKHFITFMYRTNRNAKFARAQYLPPECRLFEAQVIHSTAPFEPKAEFLALINADAEKYKLNPNLLAGVIAQESGFDPKAESWAHALGLSQLTSVAATEIESMRPSWKTLREEKKSDWRLDPEKSIEGEALYLQFLAEYWSEKSAQEVLEQNKIKDISAVILASYNSGAARVKKQIAENDKDWLEQDNLKEAFKYVNRVSSYCYHFSGGAK